MYITAFVSKWAFGEDSSQNRWRELCQMVKEWQDERPSTFDPVYFRNRDPENGRFFPEICYATDEAVHASHYYYMAKLLLATHDPSIPRLGPRMKSAMATMQEHALSYVRTMVGSATCNNYIPAKFSGSLAVIVCKSSRDFCISEEADRLILGTGASWFTDRQEQQALLDFMTEADRCSGWPRDHALQALMDEWDW